MLCKVFQICPINQQREKEEGKDGEASVKVDGNTWEG